MSTLASIPSAPSSLAASRPAVPTATASLVLAAEHQQARVSRERAGFARESGASASSAIARLRRRVRPVAVAEVPEPVRGDRLRFSAADSRSPSATKPSAAWAVRSWKPGVAELRFGLGEREQRSRPAADRCGHELERRASHSARPARTRRASARARAAVNSASSAGSTSSDVSPPDASRSSSAAR